MKILFTGGGSAGHILPIIAVYREIKKIYPAKDLQFFYIGPKDEFGSILLSQEGIKIKEAFSGKIRRYFEKKAVLQNIFDILIKVPFGIIQSFFYLFFLAPDLVFSKGGFGSVPGVIASKLFLIPIFLHESDVTPGLSNKISSIFASKIFVSFPRTEYFSPKRMILTGNPIRRELLEGFRGEAKEFLGLKTEKPVVLILGGSQGAQRINDKILEILAELLKDFEVIHQCGDKNFEEIKGSAKVLIPQGLENSYHPYSFLKEEELKKAYAVANFVVSRAGSGSIFEIAAAGLPSILIPLPESAQNHQLKNAYAYAENGAAVVIEESNFTSHFFLERLRYFFSQLQEMQKMQNAAREFSKPLAAKVIAEEIINYLTRR